MLMFLTILAMSVFSLAICVAAFGMATQAPAEPETRARVAVEPPRFFARPATLPPASPLPIDVLLSQIERHVRLEQAAAEAYLDRPTHDALHSPTSALFPN
jgi:hypothetical protein